MVYHPWKKEDAGNQTREILYTISLSNPLAPKTATVTETQVNSTIINELKFKCIVIYKQLKERHICNLSDSVQGQSGEWVLHHRCWGRHTWCALPRLLLHPQPLHAYPGGQEQVSVTVSKTWSDTQITDLGNEILILYCYVTALLLNVLFDILQVLCLCLL